MVPRRQQQVCGDDQRSSVLVASAALKARTYIDGNTYIPVIDCRPSQRGPSGQQRKRCQHEGRLQWHQGLPHRALLIFQAFHDHHGTVSGCRRLLCSSKLSLATAVAVAVAAAVTFLAVWPHKLHFAASTSEKLPLTRLAPALAACGISVVRTGWHRHMAGACPQRCRQP